MFGVFGRRKRKHYERLDDAVWVTAAAKESGLLRLAASQGEQGVALCCVSSGAFRKYRDAVAAAGSSLRVIEAFQANAASLKGLARNGELHLHVPELHARLADEERFLAGLDAPDLKVKVQFHTSLDDPALRPFVAGSLKEMLEKLGLKPDEPITHRFVTRAIANARRKAEGS